MMTSEEILEYISKHEPTQVDKCPDSGRWLTREWDTGETTIIETYTYKHPHTHRQSFAVKSVDRKEIDNG